MNPKERDDFAHALGQTIQFFGKELDKPSLALWIRAFAGKEYPAIREALLEYTKIGRFAPRPRDILEIMDTQRIESIAKLPPPQKQDCQCPPEIAKAWSWFIRMHSGYECGPVYDPTPEDEEVYLRVVNMEAQRLNEPDSIPGEFKLREVWGAAA